MNQNDNKPLQANTRIIVVIFYVNEIGIFTAIKNRSEYSD